jgi:hypothetical protein
MHKTVRDKKIVFHDDNNDDPDWMVKKGYTLMIAVVTKVQNVIEPRIFGSVVVWVGGISIQTAGSTCQRISSELVIHEFRYLLCNCLEDQKQLQSSQKLASPLQSIKDLENWSTCGKIKVPLQGRHWRVK